MFKSRKLQALFTGTAALMMLTGTSAFADSRHRAETRNDSQPQAQQTQSRDARAQEQSGRTWNRSQSPTQNYQRYDRSQAPTQNYQRYDRSQAQTQNYQRYDRSQAPTQNYQRYDRSQAQNYQRSQAQY